MNFSCSDSRQFWRLRYTDAAVGGNAQTADLDGDGLSNLQEAMLGTDPLKADTDDDGFQDGEEHGQNSDPLNSGQVPQAEFAETEDPAKTEKAGISTRAEQMG